MKISKNRRKCRTHRQSFSLVQKIILGIIAIASVTVIIASICAVLLQGKNRTEALINRMAVDYYENYFYPNFSSTRGFQQITDIDDAMTKYHDYGFSPIRLRQLLLYDNRRNDKYRDEVTKYCDENKTFIKFYIDPPYEKTSYHYEITYSCNY